MVGKKGWLRILEAFIAVIIIAGILLVIVSNQRTQKNFEEDMHNFQRAILLEISQNKGQSESIKILNDK